MPDRERPTALELMWIFSMSSSSQTKLTPAKTVEITQNVEQNCLPIYRQNGPQKSLKSILSDSSTQEVWVYLYDVCLWCRWWGGESEWQKERDGLAQNCGARARVGDRVKRVADGFCGSRGWGFVIFFSCNPPWADSRCTPGGERGLARGAGGVVLTAQREDPEECQISTEPGPAETHLPQPQRPPLWACPQLGPGSEPTPHWPC